MTAAISNNEQHLSSLSGSPSTFIGIIKGDFDRFLDEFFKAIHSRYDIEKPHIRRYIRRKLGIINSQKQEIADLKALEIYPDAGDARRRLE